MNGSRVVSTIVALFCIFHFNKRILSLLRDSGGLIKLGFFGLVRLEVRILVFALPKDRLNLITGCVVRVCREIVMNIKPIMKEEVDNLLVGLWVLLSPIVHYISGRLIHLSGHL